MPYKDPEAQRKSTREWIARRRQAWLDAHPCHCGKPSTAIIASTGVIPKGCFAWREERRARALEACGATPLCAGHRQEWASHRAARLRKPQAPAKAEPTSPNTEFLASSEKSKPWENPAYRAEITELIGGPEGSPEWWAALILLAAPIVGPEQACSAVGAPAELGEQVAGRMRGCGAWVKEGDRWLLRHEWLDLADPEGSDGGRFAIALVLDVLTAVGKADRSFDPAGDVQYASPPPAPDSATTPASSAPRRVAAKHEKPSRSASAPKPRSSAGLLGNGRPVGRSRDASVAGDDAGGFDRKQWRAERRRRLGYGLPAPAGDADDDDLER